MAKKSTKSVSTRKARKATAPKPKPVKILYPEQLNTVYSNHTGLSMSGTDLILDFGLRQPQMAESDSEPPITIHTRVLISPQHAKDLREKLNWIIQEYEKEFGEIQTKPKSK